MVLFFNIVTYEDTKSFNNALIVYHLFSYILLNKKIMEHINDNIINGHKNTHIIEENKDGTLTKKYKNILNIFPM